MPQKNSLKEYKENCYYHIYNRGVAKQEIYQDEQDFKTFLAYLKFYLSPTELQGDSLKSYPSRQLRNHSEQVNLLCYCLMPNHFHLLIHQREATAINFFMRSLGTKYSMYFNKRYNRVGPLFQSTYKAVEVTNEEQLIYLSKYIHRNPLEALHPGRILEDYPYSSYLNYLGLINQTWMKPKEILAYFSKTNQKLSYQSFVEETDEVYSTRLKGVDLDFRETP